MSVCLDVFSCRLMMGHWGFSAWRKLDKIHPLLGDLLSGLNNKGFIITVDHHFVHGVFTFHGWQVTLSFESNILKQYGLPVYHAMLAIVRIVECLAWDCCFHFIACPFMKNILCYFRDIHIFGLRCRHLVGHLLYAYAFCQNISVDWIVACFSSFNKLCAYVECSVVNF